MKKLLENTEKKRKNESRKTCTQQCFKSRIVFKYVRTNVRTKYILYIVHTRDIAPPHDQTNMF